MVLHDINNVCLAKLVTNLELIPGRQAILYQYRSKTRPFHDERANHQKS